MADERIYELDEVATVPETYTFIVDANTSGVITKAKRISKANLRTDLAPLEVDFTLTCPDGTLTVTRAKYYKLGKIWFLHIRGQCTGDFTSTGYFRLLPSFSGTFYTGGCIPTKTVNGGSFEDADEHSTLISTSPVTIYVYKNFNGTVEFRIDGQIIEE